MKKIASFAAKLLVLGSLTALGVTSAQAQQKYWANTTGTGSLTTNGNWVNGAGQNPVSNPTTAPGTTDQVRFSNNAVLTADVALNLTTSSDIQWGSIRVVPAHTQAVLLRSNNSTQRTLTLNGNLGSTIPGYSGSATDNVILDSEGSGGLTLGGAAGANPLKLVAQGASGSSSVIYTKTSSSVTLNSPVSVNSTSGTGAITLIAKGGGTLTVNGSLFDGNQPLALSVDTGSNVVLANSNSFTGATTIDGTLHANAANSLGSTTSVAVNSGGSLVFGASNALNSAASVTLTSGSILLNGTTQTIGALTLVSGVNIIDFTSGGILTLNSIASWATGATLEIIGWSGDTIYEGDSTHKFILGGTAAADIASHLDDITWTNVSVGGGPTFGPVVGGQISGVQLTPVPEPSTIFIGLGLLALLAWSGRRKLLEAGRHLVPVRL